MALRAGQGTGAKPGAPQIAGSIFGGLRMGPFFSATFEPSLAIAAGRIDKLGVDIRSFREPLTRAVKEVMMPSINTNFNVEGRPAWEPLSETTLGIRAAQGWSGGGILLLTGTLRDVATSFGIWEITTTAAVVRDLPQRAWYGKVHQQGYGGSGGGRSMSEAIKANGGDVGAALKSIVDKARAGGSRGQKTVSAIPARPFLVLQPQDEEDIQDIFMEWLEERVNRVWP